MICYPDSTTRISVTREFKDETPCTQAVVEVGTWSCKFNHYAHASNVATQIAEAAVRTGLTPTNEALDEIVDNYLSELPRDPMTSEDFEYLREVVKAIDASTTNTDAYPEHYDRVNAMSFNGDYVLRNCVLDALRAIDSSLSLVIEDFIANQEKTA